MGNKVQFGIKMTNLKRSAYARSTAIHFGLPIQKGSKMDQKQRMDRFEPKDQGLDGGTPMKRRTALGRALMLASAPLALMAAFGNRGVRAAGRDDLAAERITPPAASPQIASNAGQAEGLPTLALQGHKSGDNVETALGESDYLVVSGGQYRVSQDTVVTGILHFMGGSLLVDEGVTLTINGQVIAPARQIFFGNGIVEGPCHATEVRPEWFGAIGNGYEADAHDDTQAVQRALHFVRGGILRLSGMYSLAPGKILITRHHNGIHIVGQSGAAAKDQNNDPEGQIYRTNPTGFCLREDGEWMIGFGNISVSFSSLNDAVFEDIIFDGLGNKAHLGLIWGHNLRTSKFRDCTFKSVRGAGLFNHKLEDVTFSGCQFTYLGVPKEENKYGLHGGIIFGAAPKFGRIGTNVVYFCNHCRFEWMDGGFINALREPVERSDYDYNTKDIPTAKHIHIVDSKMEIGNIGGWGESRGDYPVFGLADLDHHRTGKDGPYEDHHPAENWHIGPGNHLNDPHHASWFMVLGKMDNVSIHGNSFSVWGKCDFVKFASPDVENFWCTDNGTRSKSSNDRMKFVNDFSKARYAYKYDDIHRSQLLSN